MIDLFVTTYGRPELFQQSFQSLLASTDRSSIRLTVVVDGGFEKGTDLKILDHTDHVLWHRNTLGLGPSINQALSHIANLNTYFDNQKSDFVCMCQDDIVYVSGWLEKLVRVYALFSKRMKLGFVTGHEAIEHQTTGEIKFGDVTLLIKPWIRATNMLTTTEYFLSMYPIPRIDPETGKERARPHNGMGSSVDWHFIRNHPNSVCKTGRINIVYPGLIKHIGFDQSTWLKRPLPEAV